MQNILARKIKDELPENMKIALKNIDNLKILIPDKKNIIV